MLKDLGPCCLHRSPCLSSRSQADPALTVRGILGNEPAEGNYLCLSLSPFFPNPSPLWLSNKILKGNCKNCLKEKQHYLLCGKSNSANPACNEEPGQCGLYRLMGSQGGTESMYETVIEMPQEQDSQVQIRVTIQGRNQVKILSDYMVNTNHRP